MSEGTGNLISSWNTSATLLCATSAAAAAVAAAGLAYQKTVGYLNSPGSKAEPKRWMQVGIVKELIVYPVKGCAGIHMKQAKATKMGLKEGEFLSDRVFMVVNTKGVMQSQVQFPQLSLVTIKTNDNGQVTLKAPDVDPVTFGIPGTDSRPNNAYKIFQENGLQAVDCGDEAGEWLESYLGKPGIRLVYHNLDKSQRKISGLQKHFSTVSTSDLAAFQNYTAFLLISQTSIDKLNEHLDEKVTAKNFRPSILVEGVPEAFAEIRWGVVRIGEHVMLKASKPCERCKIVTVNEYGEHSADGEPLKTLTKLQMEFGDETAKNVLKNRGIMGLQMGLLQSNTSTTGVPDGEAVIKVGDPVYVALL